MIELENVTYRIGGRLILDEASVLIPNGRRVGLIGPNGSGKTTLLRLILKELEPDKGSIRLNERAVVASVAQHTPDSMRTPLDEVLAADRERSQLLRDAELSVDPDLISDIHNRLADISSHRAPARAGKILSGLGFDEKAQATPLNKFSGGWQMRVALAAALFVNSDILLLDEPTNHLDLEATLWFSRFLEAYPGTAIVVSHDRSLLNIGVNHILSLEDKSLRLYRGTYEIFERTHRENLKQQARFHDRQTAQRRRMERFVERFRYKATKARQAQSRLKMLAKLEPITSVTEPRSTSIIFKNPEKLSPPLLVIENGIVAYGSNPPVLTEINLRIDPGDRIALLGANGNGKTSLARAVSGRIPLRQGNIRGYDKLNVGYFAQHQLEELDANLTPLTALERMLITETNHQLRTRLGGFGFTNATANTKIKDLSGGEKARLSLAIAGHSAPQLLVLDEPTNHLDLSTRESLVHAINDYEGAVLLITHDRHMIELCADHLWLVAEGKVSILDCNLEDYERSTLEKATGLRKAKLNTVARTISAKKNKKKSRQERAKARVKNSGIRLAIFEHEKSLESLGTEKQRLENLLANLETHHYHDQFPTDLIIKLSEINKKIMIAEQLWLKAHEDLEATTKTKED